ncbi:MAPEG family protein [Methylibium rhizosphaerae]|jgi:uncharacterized MAPEG superfamily protein|uniref:MAPEG family protein n=1 Tax=Methylibium rhizosphaerae TaxID=2570323 RepID=UPI00112786C7|nr:MAPEG family protein [Methylibium rhizosphaerae]
MNLIAWSLLAAAVMPVACAGMAKWGAMMRPRREGGFDNHHPREWLARQQGWRARANAAQANCFEALPFFIGAVLYALLMQAPAARIEALAGLWLLLRAAYVALYLADRPSARSVVWTLALAANVAILFSA